MLSGFELYPRWVPLFRSGSADERKKRESSEKSGEKKKKKKKSGENSLQPSRSFSHFFLSVCLHYLGAWNTLNFGSRAGHLSGRSDHRAQKSYL